LARRVALVLAVVAMCFPAAARANGDPASDYLLAQDVFLPFNAKIDAGTAKRLQDVVKGANDAGYKIKVALILTRNDLGTAFSLYNKPQRYAQFLGLELSFLYQDNLLVVMPKGHGFAVNGEADPPSSKVLKPLPEPGRDATRLASSATRAVTRLATASGHRIVVSNGGSETRDRVILAAAAVAGAALIAAVVLYRRRRRQQVSISEET
jgi:hypothetical protein